MKTAKHVTALILCLCVLVGLPISVQAIGTSNASGLYIHTAVARPNKNGADTSFIFYVSKDVTQYNLPATSFEGANVEYYMNIYDSNGNLMDGGGKVELKTNNDNNAMDGGSYGAAAEKWARVPAISFADATMTFSSWKAQGAARFEFCLVETDAHTKEAYEGNERNDYVWKAASGGNTLWAKDKINGQDATIIDIITQDEWLTIDDVTKTANDKITVKFSEPVAMSALKADGGPVDVWVGIVDDNNNLVTYTKEDGTTAEYQYQATAVAPYAGNSAEMEFTIPELERAQEQLATLVKAGNNYSLRLFIADNYDNLDCANRGEAAGNCAVDGIWSVATKCPLIADYQSMSDYLYRDIVLTLGIDQLDRATEGDTVMLYEDTDMTSQTSVLMVPAGVTLDLNGYTLKTANLVSFGDVIDSSQGAGGIIISQDKAQAATHLQSGNSSFPLYDRELGGFRFYSYIFSGVGTKNALNDNDLSNDDDLSWVKFGIKLRFESEKAYELLAHDDNQDAALMVNIAVGNKDFTVQFSQKTLQSLASAVSGDAFAKRTKMAVTLTVRGLGNLSENAVIKATPMLYSGRDVAYTASEISYLITTPVGMARAWVEEQINNNTLFSFDYNDQAYAEHISTWEKNSVETETGWTVTYSKDSVTAWSEITIDEETASIEWTNYFKNNGSGTSKVISNIQAIKSDVTVADAQFTSAFGSNNAATDFQPIHQDLTTAPTYTMESSGGRSSSGAFPYFEIHNGDYGVIGGIGWTGNWKASFAYADGDVSITAGMKETSIALKKGEQMRTPMMMLMFYDGNQEDGHNDFRQLILKNYTPTDVSGEPISSLPTFVGINACNGENDLIAQLDALETANRPFDGLWIDATWFGNIAAGSDLDSSGWRTQVGNWYFNSSYPNGNILNVSNWLEERDKELLVWFEPERVADGTDLDKTYDTLLYNLFNKHLLAKDGYEADKLWNFANDDARDVMIDKISSIISTNKITWYRQDFNMEPEAYWEQEDDTNRVGMTEIKYITNLYYYLDALVEQNPGLMIDNCASGGRRLDLEMMSRSVPMWRSDFTTKEESTPDNVRTMAYNLSWWLPLHGGGYPNYNEKNTSLLYDLRSYFTGAQVRPSYSDEAVIQQVIREYNEYKDILVGDYHILSCGTGAESMEVTNAAYEYYLSGEGRGFVMTFRPQGSTIAQTTYKLQGLDPVAIYEIEITDTGETWMASGQSLMVQGLTCQYPSKAYSMLIYLNKI